MITVEVTHSGVKMRLPIIAVGNSESSGVIAAWWLSCILGGWPGDIAYR